MEQEHNLKPSDLAKKYQCSARHIQRLAETGQIPGVRLGNLWRFNADEVRDALKEIQARSRKRESQTSDAVCASTGNEEAVDHWHDRRPE